MVETSNQEAASQTQNKRRLTMVGRVVSDKMDKTVTVAVERRRRHPIYGKTVARTRRFYAHDPENECIEGDLVRIEESRPFSKTKTWVVREIIERPVRV